MKKIVVIGAGDFGREVAWLISRINDTNKTWDMLGFVDDSPEKKGGKVDGYKVVGDLEWLISQKSEIYAVCTISDGKIKKSIVNKVSLAENIKFATLIDPTAIIGTATQIEEGCIICAGTILTVAVKVKRHSIINLNCTVGHDSVIGEFCALHPGCNISGKVEVEGRTYIGTGTKVRQGIKICSDCNIGAGTIVIKDIAESGTYVGCPCKKIK